MGVQTLTTDELRDVEAIRKLRSLYAHLLDAHEWDALAQLFTEDAVCEFAASLGLGNWHGRREIRERYSKAPLAAADPFAYLHLATNGVIDIMGPNTANGRWFLLHLQVGLEATQPVSVTGVYDETYTKIAGEWFISRTRLDHSWRKPG